MTVPNQNQWALKPVHVEGLPPWIDVHPESGLSIGRADDNDVTLAAEEHAGVSAHHLRISMRDGQPRLIDLESTNHTYVNGMRIKEKVLKSGDVIGLGSGGPRFVVELRQDMSATRIMETTQPEQKFGESTIQLVREAVGLEERHEGISSAVEERTRSNRRIFAVVVAVLAAVGTYVVWSINRTNDQELRRLEQLNQELTDALERTSTSLEIQMTAWEAERERLRAEKLALVERIRRLESSGDASTATLADLRLQLDATNRSLKLFDPVTAEQQRLASVNAVRAAVVFITTEIAYRERGGDRLLRHVEHPDGMVGLVLADSGGEVITTPQTGSGFVVNADGYILTNAHVIEAETPSEPMAWSDATVIDPVVHAVTVVFNKTADRYPARVVATKRDDENDFGVLKIEPFEGMPHVRDFDMDVGLPDEGTEVILFGFPLGRHIVQGRDNKMFASMFQGILSRQVDRFLQVDAAVYPGNSGGPMIDAKGRVLGIVTAVAKMPDGGQLTPQIGYVYPIGAIRSVWPPKD